MKVTKFKVAIIHWVCGDDHYGFALPSWAHTFYPSHLDGWDESLELARWQSNESFSDEFITFADAIDVDGKLFIEGFAFRQTTVTW